MLHNFFIAVLASLAFTSQAVTDSSPNGRIVNGRYINIEQRPFQLALYNDGDLHCGAVLLHKDVILSAAHCVNGAHVKHITVGAGSTNRSDTVKFYQIRKYLFHPDYHYPHINDHDIALLFPKESIVIDGIFVKAISLPYNATAVGTVVTASGWGLDENGIEPDRLKAADFNIVELSVCPNEHDTILCGKRIDGIGCFGDSGGPVTAGTELIGILSHISLECRNLTDLGRFTDVHKLIGWIQNKTQGIMNSSTNMY